MSKCDFHDYENMIENMMNFHFCNFGMNQTHCLYHFCSRSCQNGINNGSYLTHMCVIMKIMFGHITWVRRYKPWKKSAN